MFMRASAAPPPQMARCSATIPRIGRCPLHNSPVRLASRLYTPVQSPAELDDLLLASASARRPLVTFWTASWCASCRAVRPAVRALMEAHDGGGESDVGFVEVELDAPDNAALGMRYMISSIPTLLAFRRQEALLDTKITDATKMKDPVFMKRWIQESRDDDGGGKGGPGNLFTGLFGKR